MRLRATVTRWNVTTFADSAGVISDQHTTSEVGVPTTTHPWQIAVTANGFASRVKRVEQGQTLRKRTVKCSGEGNCSFVVDFPPLVNANHAVEAALFEGLTDCFRKARTQNSDVIVLLLIRKQGFNSFTRDALKHPEFRRTFEL